MSALTWVPCCRCGTPCVSTPAVWVAGAALCTHCRPAPAVPPGYTSPIGRSSWPDAYRSAPIHTAVKPAPHRYRMLVAGRLATPADPTVTAVTATADLAPVRVGYGLVEDTEAGQLVHVVKVYQSRGWGWWRNGRFNAGISWHERLHSCSGLAEWTQHARGLYWEPPPTPPCPRCGRLVRLTNAGQPYAHSKPAEAGGGKCT